MELRWVVHAARPIVAGVPRRERCPTCTFHKLAVLAPPNHWYIRRCGKNMLYLLPAPQPSAAGRPISKSASPRQPPHRMPISYGASGIRAKNLLYRRFPNWRGIGIFPAPRVGKCLAGSSHSSEMRYSRPGIWATKIRVKARSQGHERALQGSKSAIRRA